MESCAHGVLCRSKEILMAAGFKLSHSGEDEVVGVKGDYKGIIACLSEKPRIAVFTVGGPNYEQAQRWAVEMKERF